MLLAYAGDATVVKRTAAVFVFDGSRLLASLLRKALVVPLAAVGAVAVIVIFFSVAIVPLITSLSAFEGRAPVVSAAFPPAVQVPDASVSVPVSSFHIAAIPVLAIVAAIVGIIEVAPVFIAWVYISAFVPVSETLMMIVIGPAASIAVIDAVAVSAIATKVYVALVISIITSVAASVTTIGRGAKVGLVAVVAVFPVAVGIALVVVVKISAISIVSHFLKVLGYTLFDHLTSLGRREL